LLSSTSFKEGIRMVNSQSFLIADLIHWRNPRGFIS
jgi:hypothetical protein